MKQLEPWIYSPLELIKHAEEHQQLNRDFDRLIALIGYDNAIEVSISTYLQLHPSQRAGTTYRKEDVANWHTNFHTLLDFFYNEFLKGDFQAAPIPKATLIHYHSLRNNLYHEGNSVVPSERDIEGAHVAALFVFSSLFHVDGKELLKNLASVHTLTTQNYHFKGSGNDIFKLRLKAEPVVFRITYRGKSSHQCHLHDENDKLISKLFDRLEGSYSSREQTQTYAKSANIEKEGVYLFRVTAYSGTWDIEVEQ